MLFTLVGTLVLGIATAGTLLVLINLLKLPLPRWIVPAAAGATMLGFTIYIDYTWYDRLIASLSDRSEVVETYRERNPLKPWSYLLSPITRFVVVDSQSAKLVEGSRGTAQAVVVGVGRWQPTWVRPMLFDCIGARRADLPTAPVVDADGDVEDVEWVPLDPSDPLLRTVCQLTDTPIGRA